MKSINRFFIWCSGASNTLLAECPESEQKKYGAIGATVLFTSIFAFVASSYALFSVFFNMPLALALGAFWAMVIFNLDRWIVSTMDKKSTFLNQFAIAAPRFLIAALISVVISKPLELRLFEDRIVYEINETKGDKIKGSLEQVRQTHKIDSLNAGLRFVENQIVELEKKRIMPPPDAIYGTLTTTVTTKTGDLLSDESTKGAKRDKIQAEINTLTNSPYEIVDDKKVYIDPSVKGQIQDLVAQRNSIDRDLKLKKQELGIAEKEKREAEKDWTASITKDLELAKARKKEVQANITAANQLIAAETSTIITAGTRSFNSNLITQMEALGALLGKDKTLKYVNLFLMLLFLFIEIAPVLVKLFSNRGNYDELESFYHDQLLTMLNYRKEEADLKGSLLREETALDSKLKIWRKQVEHEEEYRLTKIEEEWKVLRKYMEGIDHNSGHFHVMLEKLLNTKVKAKDPKVVERFDKLIDDMTATYFGTMQKTKVAFETLPNG